MLWQTFYGLGMKTESGTKLRPSHPSSELPAGILSLNTWKVPEQWALTTDSHQHPPLRRFKKITTVPGPRAWTLRCNAPQASVVAVKLHK